MIKFPVTVGMLKKLETDNLAKPETLGWEFSHSPDATTLMVDASFFTKEAIAKLKSINALTSHGDKMKLTMRIKKWESITGSVQGERASKNLITLADQLKVHFNEHCSNGWVFMESLDGNLLPYFVYYVGYYKAKDEWERNRTSIHLQLSRAGKTLEHVIRFHDEDLRGTQTIGEMLDKKGITIENASLTEDYFKEIELYKKYSGEIGKQFNAEGKAHVYDKWTWKTLTSLGLDGKPDRVIVESVEIFKKQEETRRGYAYQLGGLSTAPKDKALVFWRKTGLHPPVHPYVFVYNLRTDRYMEVNSTCLTPYIYNKEMSKMIVLPEETSDILDIVLNSETPSSDVVEGKSGGLAILCTGDPGVGKTLTAEVSAEMLGKPLYRVHSSQLGITAPELEKNLQNVLACAERWKAILLVDEADVYIHKRGTDLNQAAVVGVWLRLLEYYNGILFMTSNRATVVDDAIMSRVALHLKFLKPTVDALKKIWLIQAEQAGVTIAKTAIDKITKVFSGTSGRDVKNLVKIAKSYAAKKNVPIDLSVIEKVAPYKNVLPTIETK